jgi:predicted unusual protein kinase regulating ubiquinone biosynthesis (AarF/ABC1/UbiB family)
MQLMNGTVHSDIHPGNIRVTEKNEVVWLDRNFYIQLNNKDKAFLMGMYASLSNPEAVIGQVFDYLEGEGTHFEDGMKEHIRSRVHEILGSDDQTNQHLHKAVLLRKEGVRFPLKITLLIKDIFYLDRLAKKVGFSSLADAMS